MNSGSIKHRACKHIYFLLHYIFIKCKSNRRAALEHCDSVLWGIFPRVLHGDRVCRPELLSDQPVTETSNISLP
jgi:hypothetical protein